MTVLQLKRSMDAGFRRVDRRFARVDRRMGNLEGRLGSLEGRMGGLEGRVDGLTGELRQVEERLKRHFDVVVESIHDDMRIFAEAIGVHSDRLGDHDARLRRLEHPRRP